MRADKLVRDAVHVRGDVLHLGELSFSLKAIRRILVVGAGKAGAGMSLGLLEALGQTVIQDKQLTGWVNVPADCVEDRAPIHLHAARPAGQNEPTAEGVFGAEQIFKMLRAADSQDLCIVLISGGGSALLPLPREGITLADKLAVTRHLSAAGANIEELNAVRKQLSRAKGGGLAREARAGNVVALIISDVLGDPLDVIASGPTVPNPSTPQDALAVLEKFKARDAGVSPRVFAILESLAESSGQTSSPSGSSARQVHNLVIGNNAVAVDAAFQEAVRRGYSPLAMSSTKSEGLADTLGQDLLKQGMSFLAAEPRHSFVNCIISGGEPVVVLAPESRRGKGGRNQQLALAALCELNGRDLSITLLSGGTDGEDGPTDAAGAIIDESSWNSARQKGLDPFSHLQRNDSYPFFDAIGGLIRTGPTHTNVCDLRVILLGVQPAG